MKQLSIFLFCTLFYFAAQAQIPFRAPDYLFRNKMSVGARKMQPTPNQLLLQVGDSITTKAMKIPVVDSVNAVDTPWVDGMVVADLQTGRIKIYMDSAWRSWGESAGTDSAFIVGPGLTRISGGGNTFGAELDLNYIPNIQPGGASTAIQYNKDGEFRGNEAVFAYDSASNSMAIGSSTPASKLSITNNNLASSVTNSSGLSLINSTAAADGSQQYSPALRFRGSGWKTNATAASQTLDIMNYLIPIQGTSAPNPELTWRLSTNGGVYSRLMSLYSTGLQVSGGLSFSGTQPIANTIYGSTKLWFAVTGTSEPVTYNFGVSTGFQQTSGTTGVMQVANGSTLTGFFPTSGTATNYTIRVSPVLNQTGTAWGDTWGILIDPGYISPISKRSFKALEIVKGAVKMESMLVDVSDTITTTNATVTNLDSLNLVTAGTEMEIDITIIGESGTDKVMYRRLVRAKNQSGTVSILGSAATIGSDFEDAALTACSVGFAVVGYGISPQVTGIAATTISWRASYTVRYL